MIKVRFYVFSKKAFSENNILFEVTGNETMIEILGAALDFLDKNPIKSEALKAGIRESLDYAIRVRGAFVEYYDTPMKDVPGAVPNFVFSSQATAASAQIYWNDT